MLRYPLPPVPDASIPLRCLNPSIYQQLCVLMDQECSSSKLLTFMLKKIGQESALKVLPRNYTSVQMFSDLDRWSPTVGDFANLLEECGLMEPLYLLKDRIPLEIMQQPLPEIVAKLHQKVELTFIINGFPKPTFQWYFNNVKLDGEATNLLVITDFRDCNAGSYNCKINQQCRDGSIHTIHPEASVIYLEPFAPFVVKHPQDCQIKPGDFIELRCLVEGYPIPGLQWFKDDTPLVDKTTPILQIAGANSQDSGLYWCLATNSEGKIKTNEAVLEVVSMEPNFQLDVGYCQLGCATDLLQTPSYGFESFSNLDYADGVKMLSETVDAMNDIFAHKMSLSTSCIQRHTAPMKQALLIGNWSYDKHQLLKVRADVKTLHEILYKMEFEVLSLCNLTKMEILNAADRFCELLIHDAYTVVYFAGHGIHYFNDYLMPVDLDLDSDYSVRDLVDVNEIIAKIQKKSPKLFLILLDMCRTIPNEEKNMRLRKEMPKEVPRDSQSNLVMAWATSENSSAYELSREENGIFMTYLKREMENHKLSVTDMLERLKRHSKRDIPVAARDQMPVIFSSLAEPLSLYDPVDRSIVGGTSWNNCLALSNHWKELPENQTIQAGVNGSLINIRVGFSLMDGCFSNGLRIKVLIESNEQVTLQPKIRPNLLEPIEISHNSAKKICIIAVYRLQLLMEDAVLFLELTGVTKFPEKPIKEVVKINLGQPLIAKARLAFNNFS